ncbi:hypothetical protein ABMA28_004070 [Loxostege sticticalis]|uniref:Uncharacterized protein n=1 Tax=Loxostege sticticalis TaxID=481309 RepID=A0ABD0SWG1_LOXSC
MPRRDEAECCCCCCDVKTVCGRSLRHGVVFVGFASLVIASIMLIVSLVMVVKVSFSDVPFYMQPTEAVSLIFGLVSISVSTYQFIISSFLLYQALKTKGNIFICSVWYTSHLSILAVYFMIFCAQAVVCIREKRYACAAVSIVFGILYESTYIYFTVIVNSFLHSLDLADRYF